MLHFVQHDMMVILPERTHIRWHIDMTLPAVIITPQWNQNIGMLRRVMDRRRATIVHFVCGLIRLPERGCHFHIRMSVWVVAECLLQGVVDCAGI